jgi:DNA-binding CsgD family transcriptional regulator
VVNADFYQVPADIGAILAMIDRCAPRLMKLGGSLSREGMSVNRLKYGALHSRTVRRIEELAASGKYSRAQIARMCDVSVNTVYVRLRKAT